jgi:threonine dehydrogenase-like Zn-dependent dehydrogenase
MPRELIAIAPRTPVLREYEEPPLGTMQIRIRTEFASPKHGTELIGYRDEPASHHQYDRELGAVVPVESTAGAGFPMHLGNMAVGQVVECGPEVTRFQTGDRVFGHWPIRETHVVGQELVDPLPEGITPETIVCLDPAVMAFPIRDAGIQIGDRVAVFGMGAIGLIAMQLARLAGADQVIAIDPIAERRCLAVKLGADLALDPRADDGDVGLTIRRLTPGADAREESTRTRIAEHVVGGFRDRLTQLSNLGVDVAVEVSGNVLALHDAIRSTRFGGTVCVLSYYGGDSAGLRLGEEFHVNRLELISARAGSLPLRDAPGWTYPRLVNTALAWLISGRLRTDGIISPIVPFADAVDAYRSIDEHPDRSIKLGIRF